MRAVTTNIDNCKYTLCMQWVQKQMFENEHCVKRTLCEVISEVDVCNETLSCVYSDSRNGCLELSTEWRSRKRKRTQCAVIVEVGVCH